jgi:alkyl hydroperoxide reductase subunit D
VIAELESLRERLPEPARDLKLNLQAVLEPSSGAILSEAQRWGVAVASAIAARQPALRDAVLHEAVLHAPRTTLEDAQAAAALMAMNNVFYRFRHVIEKASYGEKPARLRMNRIVKPAGPKVDFELYCLAVSAIHNCVACVKSHEAAVLEGGLTEDHVFEAIRIAAVINGAGLGLELGELPAMDAASVG